MIVRQGRFPHQRGQGVFEKSISALRKQAKTDQYLSLLANNFNPATVTGLMCRTTLSVGWMGEVYDSDFNRWWLCRNALSPHALN